jgi:branched-chain amino acid transport system substrate-binding protein
MDRRHFLAATAGLAAGVRYVSAQDKGTIKLVSSLPRTGSANGQTTTIVNGIRLAIADYNGVVAGFMVSYQDLDDATLAEGQWTATAEAANAHHALRDPDVVAYIGPYNSGAAKVSMPILNQEGLVQVSMASTYPGLTKKVEGGNPNEPNLYRPAQQITFCRVCPTDDVQGPLSARFAKDDLKAKSVYILDDKELYGRGVANQFEKRCEELAIKVLGHESIDTTRREYADLFAKVKAVSPDLVYFGGTTQTKGGQIAKDMAVAGLKCPLMVPDGCYEQAFIESAGRESFAALTCYATIGGIDPTQLTGRGAAFVKRYKEKFGKEPEAYAVYGYDAAKVVLEAVKTAGKKDRAAIRRAVLATRKFDKGALPTWGFDEKGDTDLQQMTVSKIEGGTFKPVKTVTGV